MDRGMLGGEGWGGFGKAGGLDGGFGKVGGLDGAGFGKGRLLDSAPATRRSSMASNVHNLLNPAETVERDEDIEGNGAEERKRKRVG
jgi:hypothetical protein